VKPLSEIMLYKSLATAVVALHLGYVGFVVVGQVLILLGLVLRWQWTRNLRFRVIHLVMTEVVALEGFFGIRCPMTDWQELLETSARVENVSAAPPAAPALVSELNPMAVAQIETPEPQRQIPALEPIQSEQAPDVEPMPPAQTPLQGPAAFPKSDSGPAPANGPAPDNSTTEDDGSTTFVGRLINSILFVPVRQEVLDMWYVRFGLLTLAVFLVFPPRRGAWTRLGLTGVILVWTGLLFACAALYGMKSQQEDISTPADAKVSQTASQGLVVAKAGNSTPSLLEVSQRYLPVACGVAMVVAGAGCWWRGRNQVRLET
jgi:Protein of Unknown function (DUF2784)